jgi:hypothetical protein
VRVALRFHAHHGVAPRGAQLSPDRGVPQWTQPPSNPPPVKPVTCSLRTLWGAVWALVVQATLEKLMSKYPTLSFNEYGKVSSRGHGVVGATTSRARSPAQFSPPVLQAMCHAVPYWRRNQARCVLGPLGRVRGSGALCCAAN